MFFNAWGKKTKGGKKVTSETDIKQNQNKHAVECFGMGDDPIDNGPKPPNPLNQGWIVHFIASDASQIQRIPIPIVDFRCRK